MGVEEVTELALGLELDRIEGRKQVLKKLTKDEKTK